MRGLLVKDIELMKQQKQFFVIVVVMGFILNLTGSGSVSFATGYFTVITSVLAITTISYDEFDNGLGFLMTLPVTRKQYVAEKYILGAGLSVAGWVAATAVGVICKVVTELQGCLGETIVGSVAGAFPALLMLIVSLPLVIYFGTEKGRYIAIVLWVIIIAVLYALTKTMGISEAVISEWLDGLNWGIAIAVAVLITAIGYLGSFWISVQLMEKKEF